MEEKLELLKKEIVQADGWDNLRADLFRAYQTLQLILYTAQAKRVDALRREFDIFKETVHDLEASVIMVEKDNE